MQKSVYVIQTFLASMAPTLKQAYDVKVNNSLSNIFLLIFWWMHCKKNNCAITTNSLLVDLFRLSPTFGWQQDLRYAQNVLSWESISLSRLQHDEPKFHHHDKIPLNMSCNALCSYFDSICSLLLRKIQMWWCQVVCFLFFFPAEWVNNYMYALWHKVSEQHRQDSAWIAVQLWQQRKVHVPAMWQNVQT